MGACFSSNPDLNNHQTANVVSPNGELHRFETPVTVAEVLRHLSETSSFLSNSDKLSYDEQIPKMKPDDELTRNQIYFLFPSSALRLSASEMAALAVKASLALANNSSPVVSLSSSSEQHRLNNNNKSKNNKSNKILPFIEPMNSGDDEYYNYATVKSGGQARVGSLRKLQRYSSKRAKLAVRSFRRNLSTIHEGSVTMFF